MLALVVATPLLVGMMINAGLHPRDWGSMLAGVTAGLAIVLGVRENVKHLQNYYEVPAVAPRCTRYHCPMPSAVC